MMPPSGKAVRIATVQDAEAVSALVHSAYRSEESRTGWTTEADLVGGQRTDRDMVAELITRPSSVVLLALASQGPDSPLLACCHLERHGSSAHLGMFAVRPGQQGSGVGRMMLDAAASWAQDTWGAQTLELTVLDRRPELIAWYQRRGFVLTGEQQPFPSHDPRFGTPRYPDLALLGMRRVLVHHGAAGPGAALVVESEPTT